MEETRQNRIAIYFLGSLFVFATSLAMVTYYNMLVLGFLSVLGILLASFSLPLLFYFSLKSLKTLAISIALGLGTVMIAWPIYRSIFRIEEGIFRRFSDFILGLYHFFFDWSRIVVLTDLARLWMVLVMIALLSFLIYLFLLKWYKPYVVLILVISIPVLQWAFAEEVQLISFYLTVPCLFLLYIYHITSLFQGKHGRREKIPRLHEMSIFLVPLLTILLVAVILIPKSPLPIQWTWLDDQINRLNQRLGLYEYEQFEFFTFQMASYRGEPGTLGGNIRPSRIPLLDVFAAGNVYLRGNSWNDYTGTSWQNSHPISESSYLNAKNTGNLSVSLFFNNLLLMELYQFLSGLEPALPDEEEEWALVRHEIRDIVGAHIGLEHHLNEETPRHPWYVMNSIGILYRGLETKTLFKPLYGVIQEPTADMKTDANHLVWNEHMIQRGSRFDIQYLNIHYRHHEFVSLLKESRRDLYFDLYRMLYHLENTDESWKENLGAEVGQIRVMLQDVQQEASRARDMYTLLPATLPHRVIQLAEEITRFHETDYAKVLAIEEYLRTHHSYTLSPGSVPRGRDFVDYFLFDGKTGYCTYFATAMSVLVRSIGIPARYVEGFVLPFAPISFGHYVVTGMQAHAWTEVFFEGIGWVPFEPTSPFSHLMDSRVSDNAGAQGEMVEGQPDDPFEDEYFGDLVPRNGSLPIIIMPGDFEEQPNLALWFLIPLASALALALAVNLSIFLARIIRFRTVRNKEAFRQNYLTLFKMLQAMRYQYVDSQTLLCYARGIDKVFSFRHVSFTRITEIYYRILYGGKDITAEEIRDWKQFVVEFTPLVKEIMGIWQIFLNRILLPRF